MTKVRLTSILAYNHTWLQFRMDKLGVGDSELYRNMQERGYGGSRASVFAWRTNKTQIPVEAFPILCLALGYDCEDMARMTIDYVSDVMPTLRMFMTMPSVPELGEYERDLIKTGLADRKARLMAELEELEKLEKA